MTAALDTKEAAYVAVLNDLAKQLRERRFQAGCVKTHSLRLSFTLDESGLPADCGQYQRTEAHELIEEVRIPPWTVMYERLTNEFGQFMLLTNIAVAQQVAVHFSEQAMLRRHDSPIDRRLVSYLCFYYVDVD